MDNIDTLTGDGLGNPAYDAESSQQKALGSKENTSFKFSANSAGTKRPVAQRQGVGFPVLLTDVWEQVYYDPTLPTYVCRKRAGSLMEFNHIEEWNIEIV